MNPPKRSKSLQPLTTGLFRCRRSLANPPMQRDSSSVATPPGWSSRPPATELRRNLRGSFTGKAPEIELLVGGISTPLKKYELILMILPKIWKNVPKHQPACHGLQLMESWWNFDGILMELPGVQPLQEKEALMFIEQEHSLSLFVREDATI